MLNGVLRLIVVVMGVTGSGKTTIGSLLATETGWEFADADSFHSPQNIEKMRRGIPLDDADRAPWLAAIREAIAQWITAHRNVVLACSALKRSYRKELEVGPEVRFVYLKGSYDFIYQRLRARHGHFATEEILKSQFAALEEPQDAVVVDVDQSPQEIVTEIRNRMKLA
jgi:gluconokinase